MAGETEDPEDAAARLEAALERIARHAGSPPVGSLSTEVHAPGDMASEAAVNRMEDQLEDPSGDMLGPPPPVEEIAARLDGLIDRLRAALNTSSGSRPG